MVALEPEHSALLVMDVQAEIIAMHGARAAAMVERTAAVVAAARGAKLRVIHIVVGFRPGHPEVSARNVTFAQVAAGGRFTGTPGADIPGALAPAPDEIVIAKHRVGAFAGTDLDMILRAHHIDTLIVAGIATSGVVLSTIRHAADADYRLVVIEDCCADRDDEVHRVLVTKVFARQAAVVSSHEIIAQLATR